MVKPIETIELLHEFVMTHVTRPITGDIRIYPEVLLRIDIRR